MKKSNILPQGIPKPDLHIKDQLMWCYDNYETQELETYLVSIQNTIIANFPKTTIQEGFQQICQHLEIPQHPLLYPKIKSITSNNSPQGNFLGESIDSIRKQEEIVQNLVIQNCLLDSISLTILATLWPAFPTLIVFKLYNIKFTEIECLILQRIISENKLLKLFIEYVNMIPQINQSSLVQIFLRGNQLTSEKLTQIFVPNKFTILQVLELSDNPINKEGIQILSTLINKKNSLQYIGLAKINIQGWEDFKSLITQIGPEKLNENKLQSYRDLEDKRDKQIKEQLKQKKKEVLPDIELDPLVQNTDGSYSIVRNQQMQILYFAMNNIKDQDKDQIEKFLTVNPAIQLVLQGCLMETKIKEKMRKKFSNVIF